MLQIGEKRHCMRPIRPTPHSLSTARSLAHWPYAQSARSARLSLSDHSYAFIEFKDDRDASEAYHEMFVATPLLHVRTKGMTEIRLRYVQAQQDL